jgi:hypothetical protein
VPASPSARDTVAGLLEGAGTDATVRIRPAGLEEAFMAILGDSGYGT